MKPLGLNDFHTRWSRYGDRVLAAVDRVGQSGRLILGSEVSRFESELAQWWGLPSCVGCASGLDALEIGLRCAGLQPGDKVLTTPLSAFATALAVTRAGGVPVFADVDASGQLDLELAESALADHSNVRFLVPVHLYGHALDLERLRALRERFSLRIVEDCAQAIGARSRGVVVGSVGDFAATSFYPTKNLGAFGDGGAVLTGSEPGAELARQLRDYGQSGKFEHAHLGLNSRLDELQAAILGRVLLPELAGFTRRRAEIAQRYRAGIQHPMLSLVPPPAGSQSVWHLYPILVAGDRASLQRHLERADIATGVHYPTLIPDQPVFRDRALELSLTPLPRARLFAECEVSLPIHPFLSDEDVDRVVEACNGWSA